METLIIILTGLGKFLGFAILGLPFVTGIMMETAQHNYKNKFMKFYFVIYPVIVLCGIGLGAMVAAFYLLGKG